MASRKIEGEAASMFEDDENFDAAYRGKASTVPEVSDEDDDGDEDVTESPDDDEEACAYAEAAAASDEETDDDADDDEAEEDDDDDSEETEDDEDAEVSAAREILEKRSSTVAKKREGLTKAEMIRNEIEKRKKSGDSLRACDIIATLSDKGVEVNASQVSVTLRNMGVASTRGRKPKGDKAATTPTRGRRPKAASEDEGVVRVAHRKATEKAPAAKTTQSGSAFTEADLEATAEFVAAVGGAERGATLLRIFGRMNG